jgi:hypothetical protein
MKHKIPVYLIIAVLALSSTGPIRPGTEKCEQPIFSTSLHHTAAGMGFWYDKMNGGLETLTGIPYGDLGCKNCHVAGCDVCHLAEGGGYSTEAAKNQAVCLKCHKREAAIMKADKAAGQVDVHTARGMVCADCHSAREMHGDGTPYFSMKQPGAMDTSCEKCHESLSPSEAHTVHGDRLECKACHVRHVLSCTNCHFDTLVEKGERKAIKVSGWVYLMNYKGQVTSANMQTFVVDGDKTFLMFAPANSHSIMKRGRPCGECHGTDTVRALRAGRLEVTRMSGGKLRSLKGVIPVVRDADYIYVYQNYRDGQWIPIDNPAEPRLHYAAFGEPLSASQLDKLAEPAGD